MKTILFSFCTILITSVIFAGPTIIQDNRITNIAATPVLGRGYSIATNTFQSTCLTGIKITEPSYDFTYTFNSLEKESDMSSIDTKSFSKEFRDQLKNKIFKDTGEEETQQDKTSKKSVKSEVKSETKLTSHHIFVIINLNSYYASVDESETKVSNSASQLLLNRDFPGFFSSCGSYYIRSIGRNAKFVSIFTYKTRSTKKDVTLETQIEEQIKGFGRRLEKSVKEGNGDGTKKNESEKNNEQDVKTINHASYEFRKNASSKQLTITVAAFGLGKNENATLISYDIDTFKAAIKDAFLSMQNPMTGKVSSMEVVPWVENTEFQNLIKLQEEVSVETEEEEKNISEDEKTLKKAVNERKLLLYEKKQILNQNAEFLAEIERADRNMMNIYYKAKMCKMSIDMNYKNNGILKPDFKDSIILNNRTGETMKLNTLDQMLTNEKIDGYLQREKQFMYGSAGVPGKSQEKGDGAAVCMKRIMSIGIFKVTYHEIKVCTDLVQKMANVEDEFVENYCMPTITRDER